MTEKLDEAEYPSNELEILAGAEGDREVQRLDRCDMHAQGVLSAPKGFYAQSWGSSCTQTGPHAG